ncbi:acetyl/propionyl/methylcrotonyl-CoA carboxylase subunit alpha [Streptomyces aurantiacus]|uniref:biotin carboxylase n=1 Tax=Streptomyces aurantiacus TaxID=47760 RepID=A0A7G1PD87_9ACTN|nr:biotin carboxylase N-terminal domain-containing protein [Streptomyces aurantiacus]MDQ0779130.1 acetyl-CoA carboxylase biotin carboxylase subunit [Streptomyces aurantiacus]BCL32521.1 acetyl-CoA carboxylase biotin carboxylase subunit [Streptomyces aurantiacus]
MFRTVLIANRGEIALRVARACRELGIRVAVVYSTEDTDSEVVRYADEAVRIGPGAAQASYLSIPAVVEAARRTGADAIHPGYGFLSENADFAEVCAAEGITFIGPPPDVMEALGDKSTCRALMADAGLPLLPGTLEPVSSPREAEARAAEIGFPVVVKAVAGGGGRGIGVAYSAAEFPTVFRETRRHAAAVFGDGRVYLERYLESARHVEIQVLADRFGNVVHLGERDCSVQRRHQKLIEEAPAPGLDEDVVAAMAEHAVQGAKAARYVGAGTFEFLYDGSGRFYFMEVNCRIQVEHPVTELVTGVDLVHEQLWIAAGHPLRIGQQDVVPRGCAVECRINAEDAGREFVPTPGLIDELTMPSGPFVRVDTHVRQGSRISVFYDPLLAKVTVWAPDRQRALARMGRALDEVRVEGKGLRTTTDFLHSVIDSGEFSTARHDTGLVGRLLEPAAAAEGAGVTAPSQVQEPPKAS